MENYGIAKEQQLREFLEFPKEIPSDDTFRGVFKRINSVALEKSLPKWLLTIMGSLKGKNIPIDGKNLGGSYNFELGLPRCISSLHG